jgi:hypothetical protein
VRTAFKVVIAFVLILIIGFTARTVTAGGDDEKVTICHAAGLEGTTHYETLTIGYPAVYGPAGHFYENGTPRAGHEEDYLGPCRGTTTTTTTEPSSSTTSSTLAPETTTTVLNSTTTTTNPQCPEEPCTTNPNTLPTTTSSSVVPSSSSTTTSTTEPSSSTVASTSTSSTSSTVEPSTTSSSTTSLPGETTTLPETFTFGAAATVCVQEVPTIRINFLNQFPSLSGMVGTLTMRDTSGNVVSSQPLTYEPGATVDLLYPGTSVNPDGTIADVPGWNLTDDGFWVRDPSDEFLREGIDLTYEVNPTATAFVTYPPESSACANPDGPFPPGQVPGQLPATR